MSSKRKLNRKFSDKEGKSDSDDEMGDFVLQKPKKKRICLDSESESESSCVDPNILNNDEESGVMSLEDEPLKNKAKNVKVYSSSSSLDGKTLTAKKKYSSPYSSESEASGVSSDEVRLKDASDDEDKPISNIIKKKTSKFKHRPSGTSDEEEEPISKKKASKIKDKSIQIKDRSKKMKPCSSDSSEDEPLANKHKKSFANSNSQSMTKDLHSESEDEVVAASDKAKISQVATFTKLESVHTSGSSSEDEPLAVKSKNSSICSNKSKASGILSDEIRPKDDDDDDDDDEPIINIIKKEESNNKDGSREMKSCSSDSSDDEPLANKHRKSTNSNNKIAAVIDHHSDSKDGSEASSDKDSLTGTIKSSKTNRKPKADSSLSDSEEEFLTVKSKNAKQKPNGRETKNKSVTGDLSSDDEEKSSDSLQKVLKEKVDKKKVSKDKNSSNGKIEHLKKYLRIAGIHIKSYDKLFEDCKSIKSKVEKLLGLLHEKGLKGRPTIEKCKKLKKKIETKKEIAELDLSNIIKSEGRPKRGNGGKIEKAQNTEKSPAGKKFMRLHDIIDSEESD